MKYLPGVVPAPGGGDRPFLGLSRGPPNAIWDRTTGGEATSGNERVSRLVGAPNPSQHQRILNSAHMQFPHGIGWLYLPFAVTILRKVYDHGIDSFEEFGQSRQAICQ